MSSAVLYLAIVALWGAVLVPMWLRRDGEGIGRLLHRRPDTAGRPADAPSPTGDDALDVEDDEDAAPEDAETDRAAYDGGYEVPAGRTRRRRTTRAAVIARRRRRTLGLSLLTVTAVVTVAGQVTPLWFVLPPILLLAGHLALLRVAVRVDTARRQELHRATRLRAERAAHRAAMERAEHEARLAEETTIRTAEVIELRGRDEEEVYDQYTDLRAVGD